MLIDNPFCRTLPSRPRSKFHLKMSAWGKNGSARSCEALLRRVEENDPKLTELVILPLKNFGSAEVLRLAKCFESRSSSHLRSLHASGHSIDCNALEKLGRSLFDVEDIAIGDSNMGDEGVCALCRGMEANERMAAGSSILKSIDLSWKNIGEEGLKAILRILARQSSLRRMDLSRNEKIGPSFDFWKAKSSLSIAAPIFPGLTYLDLSACCLNTKSCISLLKALQMDRTDLSCNERQQDMTEKSARDLVLKLNSNNLSDSNSVEEMMDLLAKGDLVTELYISKCRIDDDGLRQIVEAGCRSSKVKEQGNGVNESSILYLRVLDLSSNNLTTISHLVNLSPNDSSRPDCHYFSQMRTLNLSGNNIGQTLFNAIECNPQWITSLEELDLSHVSCEIAAAVELIRCSNSQDSSLKKLNLFGNGIGSNGFLELSKVLHGGHLSLEYLDLGGNGATESGVVALVEVLKNNLTYGDDNSGLRSTELKLENALRVLVVGGNSGGPALEKAVKEIGKFHPNLDIARDKPKPKNGGMFGGNAINNAPGTSWMS